MNKKKYLLFIIIPLLIIYLLIGHKYHMYIPCPIHFITGFYCPGCGVTRMLLSLIKLDFYQAFRYNPLLFIMFPFFIFFYIESLIAEINNKKALYNKVPNYIYIIIIVILVMYGILRNIFPFLAPTVV